MLYSYEGCGCAGGQITTIQGELVPRDDNPNLSARRTQKVYADILGRTKKTEIYAWDATTVYTTTTQVFNGRDQVLQTIQYAGTENVNNTHQTVLMSYDGHGRMKMRHYPIEGTTANPNAETSWIYNNDDSISQVIDPRGAITNFGYNPRGLVEEISYQVPSPNPSNITTTPTVNFSYDALGNRTQMTDGTGTQTYIYDQLSRLTSETKTFSLLSGNSFTIGYTYNLGGGLKSITDPFNATVNYTNDKTGRVQTVTGPGWTDNPSGSYANNIEYRAFGGIKRIDYTLPLDSVQMNLQYDNRLRVNHSEMVSDTITGGFLMKADYAYFADSRVQTKDDLLDDKWDRTMKYDFAGRLKFNQFGLGLGSDGQNYKRVYQQTISYDAFSQMNQRDTLHWDNQAVFTETYTNGRIANNPNIAYDAAGNLTDTTDSVSPHDFQHTTFDASGRRTGFFGSVKKRWGSIMNMVTQSKSGYDFDGDGRPVVEKSGYRNYHAVNGQPPAPWEPEARSFQVWSTVLGSSLTTILANGNKFETKVFAGGAVIGKQGTNGFGWKTADPVTGTTANLGYSSEFGTLFTKEEHEPLGQTLDEHDPEEPPQPLPGEIKMGSADDPQWQCGLGKQFWGGFQGMPFHCQMKALLNAGNKLPWEDDVTLITKFTPFTDSPVNVPDGVSPNAIDKSSLAAKMMKRALTSTSKKDKSHNAGVIAEVEVKAPLLEIDMSDTGVVPPDNSIQVSFADNEEARNALKEVVDKGDCKAKLKLLFENLKSRNPDLSSNSVRNTDALSLFDELSTQKQGGIFFNSTSTDAAEKYFEVNGQRGDVSGGGGLTFVDYKSRNKGEGTFMYVYIFPRSFSTLRINSNYLTVSKSVINQKKSDTRNQLVFILIHEMAHAAGKFATFGHREMDDAAKLLDPTIAKLDLPIETDEFGNPLVSPYFDLYVTKNCFR